MIGFFNRHHVSTRVIDPEGQRLLGFTIDTNEPLFAPRGSGMLLSAIGGGKTTRGAVPWMLSLASQSDVAQLVVDSKDGEIAAQCCKMLSDMGRKVFVIEEMRVRPELEPWRIELNLFGGVVAAYERDPRDVIFANGNISESLIPEPAGDTKNKPFWDSPRDLIEFTNNALLKRNTNLVTPGGSAAILSDSDMLLNFANIEFAEGDPGIKAQAMGVIDMREDRNWGLHLNEARKALKIFDPGTRL